MKISYTLIAAALMLSVSSAAFAEIHTGAVKDFPKWSRVVKAEKNVHVGSDAPTDLRGELQAVADRYKPLRYREDIDLYKSVDYWATRAELMKHREGDCEDFAIAAYFDLLEAGVTDDRMKIVIVYDRITNEIHAYLRVDDTVIERRYSWNIMTIEEANKRYMPIYSVNRNGWECEGTKEGCKP